MTKAILRSLLRNPATQAIAAGLLAELLKSGVKNPASRKSADLRAGVTTLRDACDEFLEAAK
jgi:hypothetical protein